jgi:hypothetical protein
VANEKVQHLIMRCQFSFFLGGRGQIFYYYFLFHDILMGFLSCSPIHPNNTLDLSHIVCPKFNAHVYKLKRWAIDKCVCLYFATKVQRCVSIWECPMFQKKWWWANQYGSKNKTCDFTQELNNMNHTLYVIVNNVGLFI